MSRPRVVAALPCLPRTGRSVRGALILGAMLLGLFATLPGCGPEPAPPVAAAQPVLVFAAASTATAWEELQPLLAQQGIALRINLGSSARLATQIAAGANAHLLLSASEEVADDLAARNLVAERVNLLGNRLVLIVPADAGQEISKLADLAGAHVRHLALADPESVPAGKYAREVLEGQGVWPQVEKKVVAGSDVRQALTFVERGEAEAGIVYATDAAVSHLVRVVQQIPAEQSRPIRYPLVLVKQQEENATARRVYQWLQGKEANAVFARQGFVPLTQEQRE